jgi:hypothetical protein
VQQEEEEGANRPTRGHPRGGRHLSGDNDTTFVRIARKSIFVREQAALRALAWTDGTRSFEKATGRKFATGKRKTQTLEEQRRAKFAAEGAQGGLQGNDSSELARAMRAWISYRNEEERTRKEKEEDLKALDVRRDRLHGLESERLGAY